MVQEHLTVPTRDQSKAAGDSKENTNWRAHWKCIWLQALGQSKQKIDSNLVVINPGQKDSKSEKTECSRSIGRRADGNQVTPESRVADICSFFLTPLLSSSGDSLLILLEETILPSPCVGPFAQGLGARRRLSQSRALSRNWNVQLDGRGPYSSWQHIWNPVHQFLYLDPHKSPEAELFQGLFI